MDGQVVTLKFSKSFAIRRVTPTDNADCCRASPLDWPRAVCLPCRDNAGYNVGPTSAYLAGCTSFSNNNGYLTCDDKVASVIEGSFEGTCSDCSQTGTTLTCTCKKSDGTSEVTSIPLDCNCPCGERKFSNDNGELTCCCDCHAGTRVALCPDGIAEPPECSGCPSYYGSRCGVQWNAPEPEAYTTECDD